VGLAFDPDVLLPLLRCPKTRAELVLVGEEWLVSTDPESRLRYRIEDGIPVLLVEEAEALPEDEWKRLVAEGRKA